MKHSESKKARLFTVILPELAAAAPYFPLAAVKRRLTDLQIAIADGSLLQYMSDAVAGGVVHDAGKGWYSGLKDRCMLDPKPVGRLIHQLEKEFPLLEFTCWSTQQVNPWMHHLFAKFISFVHVDQDGLGAVVEFLREVGYEVHPDPKGKRATEVRANGKTVVVRPLHSHAPRDGHIAPPEAVLVEMFLENRLLNITDPGELSDMAQRLAASGRLLWATLSNYADKRGVTLNDVFGESNSLSAE